MCIRDRRKQYLTSPLVQEIKERIAEINRAKESLGPEYQDNELLICQPDGRPIDPNNLCKSFKEWQSAMNITDQIDLQGLRKSIKADELDYSCYCRVF